MPPTKNMKLRRDAARAYRRAGTVRGAAKLLGLRSASRTYELIREAGVDTSRPRNRGETSNGS